MDRRAFAIACASAFAGVSLLIASGPARPAESGGFTVRVVDEKGKPLAGVVVTLTPAGATPPRARIAGPYQVSQKDMAFHPFISVVPVGATVAFPNLDPFRHHVYSFSEAKPFELKLFGRGQSRSVTFDKPGIVAVGCNIHDSMSAYIVVAETALTAPTGGSGAVRFENVPAGSARVEIWHPYLRAPGNTLSRTVAMRPGGSESITARLRAAPMTHRY